MTLSILLRDTVTTNSPSHNCSHSQILPNTQRRTDSSKMSSSGETCPPIDILGSSSKYCYVDALAIRVCYFFVAVASLIAFIYSIAVMVRHCRMFKIGL